jgi:cytoskeletal protein CcmA (bactofilin family)
MGIFGKPETKPAEPQPPARPVTAPVHNPPAPAAAPRQVPVTAPAPVPGTACVIGTKTVIKGEITGDEDVIVEGTIEGQVRIGRDLRIGPGGVVKANVHAQSIVVSGELQGDCQAAQRVEIQASGKLTGNIRAPRVVIAEGATFRGNSDMSGRKDEKR